ncbi:MAG: PAS domain S-box protein [Vicinamibacterales bacterium]
MLEVNRAALTVVGASRAEVVGRPFWDTPWWTHDERQRRRLQQAIERAAAGEADGFEATHLGADGTTVVADFSVRPVRGPAGSVSYLLVEGADVTVRSAERADLTRARDELAARVSAQAGRLARAQDALEETQALHRAVVETIVDGIVVIDQGGVMEWTNRAAQHMFGYTDLELEGRNVSMLMPAADAAGHDGYLRRYLDTGERRIIGIGRDVRGRRKDGSEFPLYLAVGETTVNGERKFTGIVRDLSETKRLEQLLQERQTLARIGELAAVVAHEVRNPLAAIRGVVEVIQTRFDPESPDRKVLGDLLTRVDSLDHLVGDLLVYARPAPPVFRRAYALALVRDTASLVANDPAATPMRVEISGDDAELWLDTAQMSRAVLNLMTNAAQAMRHEGVVRVSGARVGDRYRITLADDGPGMPEDVMARCLEPFYTTKTRGTGLGLSIAKRVVDEHRGTFSIESAPGAGTQVTIELPVTPLDAD